jgi:hypothetical protein
MKAFIQRHRDAAIALLLFFAMWMVYANSIPPAFNASYENRRFFDSDCEFIPRQFHLHETWTYNDHLLYHALARGLYSLTSTPPPQPYDSIPQHRWLSITAGALGVSLLFLFGRKFSGSTTGALAAALLVGGCAGWWYFAATIDTYLPHIAACIAALGFAMLALERQQLRDYAWLGACAGLAFLFRTDGFLLAPLGLVAFARDAKLAPKRLAVCAAAGLAVGVLGYAMIAHAVFHVPFSAVPQWALGHANRPGDATALWGRQANISAFTLRMTLDYHAIYAAILPGLKTTRIAEVLYKFSHLSGGIFVLGLYSVLMIASLAWMIWRKNYWLLAMAVLWIAPRVIFYTWWDPAEPFLFACTSLPAVWLLVISFVRMPADTARWRATLHLGLSVLVAAVVWWHNGRVMIQPLRGLHNASYQELLNKGSRR